MIHYRGVYLIFMIFPVQIAIWANAPCLANPHHMVG